MVLCVKAIVVWQLKDHPLTQPEAGLDTQAYVELAQRVIGGDWGLGPGLYYVSPLYIYFLAIFKSLFGSYTAVRVLQTILGTAGLSAVFLIAREWFDARVAWIAAALAALTGLFTFYEALILQTALDAAFTAAALLALTYALRRSNPRWWLATGVIFGLQTMNRPNVAIAAAGIIVVLLALRRWRPSLVLAVGLVLGLSPAAIRNVVVAHEFSLLSSHGGLNFYIGNHAGANGFYQAMPGITPTIKGQQEDVRRVAEKAVGHALSDAQASDYFVDQSLTWITAHPGDAVLLFARKFGWVFHAQHIALPYSYPFYQHDVPTWLRFLVVGPWLLVPLGLVGLIFAAPRTRREDFVVWASFVPCYAAAVALFFMCERDRLPLIVPLVIGSAAAIDLVWRHVTARAWTALAAPLALALVLGVAVNTRSIANDGRWQEGLRLAQQLVLIGRYDEAEAWVSRLEATAPRPGMAHDGVGMQYRQAGQLARALTHFERAAALDPTRPMIQYALGQTLLALDRPADAIAPLRRGLDGGVLLPMAGFDLALALQKTGDLAGAAAVIPRITMSDDAPIDDWLKVGRLASELHAPDAAEPFFRRAVALSGANADARLQYGVNLMVLGRFEDAARELAEAVRRDPRSASALAQLAFAEAKLGRLADAKAHAATALSLDPTEPTARQLAAVIR